jgi:hypothetical protein
MLSSKLWRRRLKATLPELLASSNRFIRDSEIRPPGQDAPESDAA